MRYRQYTERKWEKVHPDVDLRALNDVLEMQKKMF